MENLDKFIRTEALKELKKVNAAIDRKIRAGKPYKKEARIHRSLVALIESK